MFNCKFTHKIEISKIFIKKIEKYPFFCFHRPPKAINPPKCKGCAEMRFCPHRGCIKIVISMWQ